MAKGWGRGREWGYDWWLSYETRVDELRERPDQKDQGKGLPLANQKKYRFGQVNIRVRIGLAAEFQQRRHQIREPHYCACYMSIECPALSTWKMNFSHTSSSRRAFASSTFAEADAPACRHRTILPSVHSRLGGSDCLPRCWLRDKAQNRSNPDEQMLTKGRIHDRESGSSHCKARMQQEEQQSTPLLNTTTLGCSLQLLL